jgi:hypothetical protein
LKICASIAPPSQSPETLAEILYKTMYKQKKFKIINRIISYFLIFSTLFIFSIYILFFSNIVMPWEKNEIIKTTLDWGGLNKLPENSKIIEIEKRGSMFIRQFIIEFESSNSDINSWIEKNEKLKKKYSKD